MNYIIYDLEFNQKNNTSISENDIETKSNDANMPFEIIQIGALKLNESLTTISTFNSLIKPTLYESIHPYIVSLTKITDEKVALCKSFIDVYDDFLNFIGNEEFIFCVWGVNDIKELIRNVKFHNLSCSKFSKYIDIQKYASIHLNAPKKSKIGLKSSIELLDIPIYGDFHDAFNDAYYTTEVFKSIYDTGLNPSTYSPSPSKRRISKPKEKINTEALLNQFKKIYNRDLTEDEISIIKLAYKMGKTKQFIIET
ncbi:MULTISPECIES: 3'-5' exonuclease [Clostridium]|uniref:3'-5' exonuclease n=1 Tax=Clostridium TaxID=1485 RepID=UPI00098391EB|nr:3'-5' exonuclease [Clostridium saccharoperbutylacetonicum]AQR96054.1 exonuclease [Clostridium saccharoperbutylacetonicum]NSB31923.1 DNA polymerase III epsilon subunit-like protein [Clostridium saccharoperbutylacetonicum]